MSIVVKESFQKIAEVKNYKKYSDTGNRTPICSVRANRDSHYTISDFLDLLILSVYHIIFFITECENAFKLCFYQPCRVSVHHSD